MFIQNQKPIKIRFCYTIEVVFLPAIDSTEGGVMMYLIFVSFSFAMKLQVVFIENLYFLYSKDMNL